jgi:hypothetical protein
MDEELPAKGEKLIGVEPSRGMPLPHARPA